MGLLSFLFGGGGPQTKADCDRQIARLQQDIANLEMSVANCKASIASAKAHNKAMGHQTIGYSGTQNKMIYNKGQITQKRAEIAKLRALKSSLKQ